MKTHIAPITAERSHDLFELFSETLAGVQGPNALVRAGFAFATFGGVREFISHASAINNWGIAKKEFLIGIYHAITEPSALETLRSIPNTQVRVFIPGHRLISTAFDSKPIFHPKVLAISTGNRGNIRMIQSGSTNMTSAAIGHRPHNHEFSLAIRAENDDLIDEHKQFDTWWSSLWAQSRNVDRKFILKYAELREQLLRQNPILQSVVEIPQDIGDVETFFCEVGAGSGPPGYRHQIEFPEALVRFFGKAERKRKDFTLKRGEEIWDGRPLSYKKTTFGVDIWRLGMPTQNSGGDPIAGRAIRFKRTEETRKFEFEVVDVESDDFKNWVRLANIHGHLGATQGNRARRYGFY